MCQLYKIYSGIFVKDYTEEKYSEETYMNFEQPNLDAYAQEDKKKNNLKKTLQTAATLGAVAAAAFAGEGCTTEKKGLTNEDIENDPDVQRLDRAFEQSGKPIETLLHSYYDNVAKGRAPSGTELETKARAWEIAQKKSFGITDLGEIEVVNVFHVPVQIRVRGQIVPVGPDDYTKRELELVRTSEQISREMGGEIKNSSSEHSEKSNTSELRRMSNEKDF